MHAFDQRVDDLDLVFLRVRGQNGTVVADPNLNARRSRLAIEITANQLEFVHWCGVSLALRPGLCFPVCFGGQVQAGINVLVAFDRCESLRKIHGLINDYPVRNLNS